MPILHPTTLQEFDDILSNTFGNRYIFVDFFAKWCGPCKRIAPKLEAMSELYNSITFVKIDVDEINDLVQRYKIQAMPTFLLFETGNVDPIYQPIIGADETKIENLMKMISKPQISMPLADF